jgi:NADH:ubiquinone oxidoreductase subunit 6 (subunit J)
MVFLNEIAASLGISVWLLVVVFIWSFVWKLLALWKSARRKQIVWFVVFALVNTLGILEILYIYIFSDMMSPKKSRNIQDKTTRKKRR